MTMTPATVPAWRYTLGDRVLTIHDTAARRMVADALAYVRPLLAYSWETRLRPPVVTVDKAVEYNEAGRIRHVVETRTPAVTEPPPGAPAVLGQLLAARQLLQETDANLAAGAVCCALDRVRHELLPRAIALAAGLEACGVPPAFSFGDGRSRLAVQALAVIRATLDRPFTAPIAELQAAERAAAGR